MTQKDSLELLFKSIFSALFSSSSFPSKVLQSHKSVIAVFHTFRFVNQAYVCLYLYFSEAFLFHCFYSEEWRI